MSSLRRIPRGLVVPFGLLFACAQGEGATDTEIAGDSDLFPSTGEITSTSDGTTSNGTESTSEDCPAGFGGCPCGQEDICEGELMCVDGTCRGETTSTSTSAAGSSTGELPPGCNNGEAEAGELCLDDVTLYGVGTEPVDVLLADLDDDGHLDVVTVLAGADQVRVQLGDGAGGFMGSSTFATGARPLGAGLGTIDNDDTLDIVVANSLSDNVGVLPGDGDGDFGNQLTFDVGTGPVSVTVIDINGDSRSDAVSANATANTVTVLLGGGFGFLDGVSFATGLGPNDVSLAEMSGDVNLDLVVSNGGESSFGLLLGGGDGTFGTHQAHAVGASPTSLAVAQLNDTSDDFFDVVAACAGPNQLIMRLGGGNGTFGGQIPLPSGNNPGDIVTADMDNDTALDIVVANRASGTISLLLGDGDGSFQPAMTYDVGAQPSSLAVGDLNEDGAPDIVTTLAIDGTIAVMLSQV